VINVQTIPTGQLLTDFRDLLLKLGRDPSDKAISRQADQYEEEVLRRMAW
jgi:hypothetical protein